MTNKEIANLIYQKHIALAAINGRDFRKTVMDEIQATCGCTLAAAATFYNNSKKNAAPVAGLGRATASKNVRRPGSGKTTAAVQPDEECFTIIEIVPGEDTGTVGRCRSFLFEGEASENFDERIVYKPQYPWVMIKGLGPLHGEPYKLTGVETEIKRYVPV